MKWQAIAGASALKAVGSLALRFTAQRDRIDRSWMSDIGPKLSTIGEVDQLVITPLVERVVSSDRLFGEPGVSYLLRAGRTRLLFESGFNRSGAARSALVRNAESLNVDLQQLDGVVISHVHADVGGLRAAFRKSFAFSSDALEPCGLPAYVPTQMNHDRAEVVPTTGPRVIAEGVAVLPPLPAMMFWLGPAGRASARRQRARLRPGVDQRLWAPAHRAHARRH